MRRPRAAFAAAIVTCLAAAATASAAPPWSTPVDLSAADGDAESVRVAMNGAGAALPIWVRSTAASADVVQVAPRAPGGGFAAPTDLTPLDGEAGLPHVAVDAAGNAIAVWVLFDGVETIVQAATRPAGGSFGPAVDVSRHQEAAAPHVALSPSGDAVVMWLDWDGVEETVQAAVRPAGGDFGPPVVLAAGGGPTSPEIAIASDGTAIAAWTRTVGADVLAEAAVRPAGGSFPATPAPMPLSEPGGDASCPQIAIDPAGNATVAWCHRAGGDSIVQAAMRPAGGSFARAVDVSESGGDAFEPDVAVDAAGDATVAWDRWDGAREVVQAATRPFGGSFGRPVDLSTRGDAYAAQVAVAPAGDTVVAWQGDDGSDDLVEAASRPAGAAAFGAPVELSATGRDARNARVAIDDAGNALVVWERFDGSDWIAQASVLDVAGPQLTGVSVPATATVGAPVAVAVSAFDAWSPFSVAWSFGDGAGATGASASHVYAAPGTYPVTVSATDAAGGATSATRQIAVVAAPGIAPPLSLPPQLSQLKLTPAAFRAAASGPSAAAAAARARARGRARAGPPRGSRVSFRLSQSATVRFGVERELGGRRVAGRCVRATRRNRRASACTRWVAVIGGFTREAAAGPSSFAFSGRVNGRRLAPGRYRLLATPASGGASGTTAPFRILPPPPRRRARR